VPVVARAAVHPPSSVAVPLSIGAEAPDYPLVARIQLAFTDHPRSNANHPAAQKRGTVPSAGQLSWTPCTSRQTCGPHRRPHCPPPS